MGIFKNIKILLNESFGVQGVSWVKVREKLQVWRR